MIVRFRPVAVEKRFLFDRIFDPSSSSCPGPTFSLTVRFFFPRISGPPDNSPMPATQIPRRELGVVGDRPPFLFRSRETPCLISPRLYFCASHPLAFAIENDVDLERGGSMRGYFRGLLESPLPLFSYGPQEAEFLVTCPHLRSMLRGISME